MAWGILAHLATLAILASPVGQTTACGSYDDLSKKLTHEYGEAARIGGVVAAGITMEMWVSEASGSWTVVLVRVDGLACIMAAGAAYTEIPEGELI